MIVALNRLSHCFNFAGAITRCELTDVDGKGVPTFLPVAGKDRETLGARWGKPSETGQAAGRILFQHLPEYQELRGSTMEVQQWVQCQKLQSALYSKHCLYGLCNDGGVCPGTGPSQAAEAAAAAAAAAANFPAAPADGGAAGGAGLAHSAGHNAVPPDMGEEEVAGGPAPVRQDEEVGEGEEGVDEGVQREDEDGHDDGAGENVDDDDDGFVRRRKRPRRGTNQST